MQVYRIGASTHALVAASSCEQNKMQSFFSFHDGYFQEKVIVE